eukprot:scaffold5035_cov87-Cylindrotheca_fusiformis.AAC.1
MFNIHGQARASVKVVRSLPGGRVDVWVHVADSGFLSNDDLDGLYQKYSFLASWVKFGPLWISPPWPPIRRRLWGFGRISPDRSCAHDRPGHLFVIHFVWPYLSPDERERATKAYVHWELYAILRRRAVLLPLSSLHTLRFERVGGPASELSTDRAILHSIALLRFDFVYGDFVR